MDNFIVSARKYRPATFDDVVGQHSLTNTLKRAIINHKLAGAYLFCGPRGVGKTTCARIFAKAINCFHPGNDGEACNECESCISFNEGRSMNIQELNAAANNSVDDIRGIIEQVRIPPQLGNYKVIILDEVHMLSPSASNALLKTLEEPPSYVIFILATTEKQKILPTILSRCQIFDFNRMEEADIIGQLKKVAANEQITYEERALSLIAQKADGGMRDALSVFDQVTSFSAGNITYDSALKCLGLLDTDFYFRMTDAFIGQRISECLLLFNDVVNKGFDGGIFMGGLASHLRNVLVCTDAATATLLDASENLRQQYVEQAQRCHPKFLYRAIRACDKCSNEYRYSFNKRLSVEITLIELAQAANSDNDDASGLGPTQKLKPLFKDSQPTPQAAPTTAQPPVQRPTPPTAANVPPAALPAETAQPQPAQPAQPQPTRPNSTLRAIHTPSIRLKPSKPVEEPSPAKLQEAAPQYGNAPINPNMLNYYWTQYAKGLPEEESALRGRMEQMSIKLRDNGEVEVWTNNEFVNSFMKPYLPQIEAFLREKLDNGSIHLQLHVHITKEQTLRYNPHELVNKLMQENKGFANLKNSLGLEPD